MGKTNIFGEKGQKEMDFERGGRGRVQMIKTQGILKYFFKKGRYTHKRRKSDKRSHINYCVPTNMKWLVG